MTVNRLVISDNQLFACAGADGLYSARTDRLNLEWEYLGFSSSDITHSLFYGVRAFHRNASDGTLYVGLNTPKTDSISGIFRSLDDGNSWEVYDNGIPDSLSGKSSFVTELQSPEGSDMLFAALDNHIFQFNEIDEEWSLIRKGSDPGSIHGTEIRVLRFNPLDENEIWAGSSARSAAVLYHTVNQGNSWTNKIDLATRHVNTVTDIAIMPSDPSKLFITTCGNISKTEDSGSNWESVLTDLDENNCFTGVIINPRNNHQLYSVSGSVLYRTENEGFTWKEIFDEEFHHVIISLAIDWSSRIAYVGTIGSGVYKMNLI